MTEGTGWDDGRVGVEPLRCSRSRRIVVPAVGHGTTRRAARGVRGNESAPVRVCSLAKCRTTKSANCYLFFWPRFLTSIAPAPATATAAAAITAPFTPPLFFFSFISRLVFIPRNLA